MGESLLTLPSATLTEIAERIGTPAYVYDAAAMRRQYRLLDRALSGIPHRLYYSVKANSNLAVLQVLCALGAGADIVSGGELVRARRAGFAAGDIVFSGVGKTAQELSAALEHGVGLVNVESFAELQALAELARERGTVARVGIRVNPDVLTDSHPHTQTGHYGLKFGVPLDEVTELVSFAATRGELEFRSLGMHIGSQILNPSHYRDGVEKLAQLVGTLGAAARQLAFVSVGGGLGIRYVDERPPAVEEFVDAIQPLWERTRIPLAVEPGRFLVGNAGYLIMRCLYTKQSGGKRFLVVDAGMNDFARPSLYGARHAIRVLSPARDGGGTLRLDGDRKVDVVGPVCESGDAFGTGVELDGAGPGALLAILGTGAYGFSMSSTYNSRPRPAEVLVDGDRWHVVRERESVDDLMRGEWFPAEPAHVARQGTGSDGPA